ncbi:MAG: hypothetical protein EXS36_15945 [Pedosphaera sp.]|nr:hypothetical protein [Pedosphaera sp.]
MLTFAPKTRAALDHDGDAREEILRTLITERLRTLPPPRLDDQVVATYFLRLRTWDLQHAGHEISYHATSGTHDIPKGSLIEQCTGAIAGIDPWDTTNRCGLLHIAFPLKMLLNENGGLSSSDLLHTVAGAILFDVYENQDSRLVALQIPDSIVRTFPGPAHGPLGVREFTRFENEPLFGTILKPTAGIIPDHVGRLVNEVASCPLFCFVKEDENLYPRLPYSPVRERTKRAVEAIHRRQDERGGRGLIFAPHISGAPHEILETVKAVRAAGATGLMFSESFAGGTVRLVREATRMDEQPPFLYGHNAGIGVKTRSIFREVIDLLARLDGIDFRQTAPVRPGAPFLKPYGEEWLASEHALTCPLPGIRPTTIVRAGALDQGNIGLNLADVEARKLGPYALFLSGSAINSIKNAAGKPDSHLGAEAMRQAIAIHRQGDLKNVEQTEHAPALFDIARRTGLRELTTALLQRYPDLGRDASHP